MKDLKIRGLLFKSQMYEHSYPHCWRCDSPLMYFARASWFIKTTEIKDVLVSENQRIDWHPETIKNGRFGKFLENNVDWAISRNRYWGTPLPIWVCENIDCNHKEVLGSIAELKTKANEDVPDDVELHRPGIDAFTLTCDKCGGVMKRVPEVADTWFDSGSMPIAQWGYPHNAEDKHRLAENYPCDFISEAQDQTRGWFYTLHAVAGLLHEAYKKFPDDPELQPFKDWGLSYKRCILLGLILDETGQKMSKSRGGYVEPSVILQDQGADALRWNFLGNVDPWVPVRFTVDSVRDAQRRFLLTLRNVYQFFTIYARIDEYEPKGIQIGTGQLSRLDRWILARLHRTIKTVTGSLENYDVLSSAKAIEKFVDELSNWYVRRSRDRFWRSEKDDDKWAAYQTLHTCLVEISKTMAPFTPFLSEELYQNLAVGHLDDVKESVHLESWPVVEEKWLDDELEAEVELAIEIAKLGRSARKAEKIRVRQPLTEVIVVSHDEKDRERARRQEKVILDELNIKAMSFTTDQSQFVQYKVTPNFSKLGPRFGPKVPIVKKAFESMDSEQFKAMRDSLESGGTCYVELDDEKVTFTDAEVSVAMSSKDGYAAASGSRIAVVLATELTEELEAEGIARELVHHLQGLRKKADLEYQSRIKAFVRTDDSKILDALEQHRDYIMSETLASEIVTDSFDESGMKIHETCKVNGLKVDFGIVVE